MRLIDADELRAEALSWENCYNGFSDTYDKTMIIDTIDEQPTIDAVPVVRCGECNHLGSDDGMPFCYMWMREIENEYEAFCSYGLERESEE